GERTRVLITGASGLLGRAVNHELQQHKDQFETLGLCFSRQIEGLTQCDLTSIEDTLRIVTQSKPHLVVHCAAERRPDIVEKQPDRAKQLNDGATERLCQLAEECGATMLFISTDYVFDGKNPPYDEKSKPSPLNAYGESKVRCEQEVLRRRRNLVLRVPVLYGDTADVNESAVTCLFALVKAGVPCTIDHIAKRYPTHCADVANVVRHLSLRAGRIDGGVYHFSGNECLTKYEMCLAMGRVFGLSTDHVAPQVEPDSSATLRPVDARLSCQRLEATLGPEAVQRRSFEEGIRQCLAKFV
ncbi:hypothetical protein BOX15_Mlig020343g1, partial [Macrostomum lignano]